MFGQKRKTKQQEEDLAEDYNDESDLDKFAGSPSRIVAPPSRRAGKWASAMQRLLIVSLYGRISLANGRFI